MPNRPKPTAQRKLEGNPGRRRLNANEPTAVAGLPRCPGHLTGDARLVWKRLGKRLLAEKRMALVYEGAFAAYCVAWGRWVKAEREIKKNGEVIKSPNSYLCNRPGSRLRTKRSNR